METMSKAEKMIYEAALSMAWCPIELRSASRYIKAQGQLSGMIRMATELGSITKERAEELVNKATKEVDLDD